MSPILLFISYLFRLSLGLCASWLIGYLLLPRTKGPFFYQLFSRSLSGLILLSSLWAIICTRGITIHLFFLPILGYWAWENRKTPISDVIKRPTPPLLLPLLFIALPVLVIYCWSFLGQITHQEFLFGIPPASSLAANDIIQYSFISYFNGLTGQENYSHIYNELYPLFHGPKPFHYLEGWWGNLTGQLLGGLEVLNITLVSIPCFYILSFWGIVALWEIWGPTRWFVLPMGLLMLFIAGIHFPIYESAGVTNWTLPVLSYRYKVSIYYVFILGFLIETFRGRKEHGLPYLAGLAIATIIAFPAIGAALAGLMIIGFWFKYQDNGQALYSRILRGGLIILASAGLFYGIFMSFSSSSFESSSDQISVFAGFGFQWLLHKLWNMWELPLWNLTVLYAPFLLSFILAFWMSRQKWTRSDSWLLTLCGLICCSAAASYSLLEGEKEAFQLAFDIAIPLCNALIFSFICWLSNLILHNGSNGKWRILGAGVCLLCCLSIYQQVPGVYHRHIVARQTPHFSPEYLQQIQHFIHSGNASKAGVYLKGYEDYYSDFSRRPVSYTLGYYLAYMANGYVAVSISDFGIPIKEEKAVSQEEDIRSGIFYQYVLHERANENIVSIAQHQLEFIDQHKINYLIVSANAKIYKLIQSRIKESFRDPVSGESFHILSPKAP